MVNLKTEEKEECCRYNSSLAERDGGKEVGGNRVIVKPQRPDHPKKLILNRGHVTTQYDRSMLCTKSLYKKNHLEGYSKFLKIG